MREGFKNELSNIPEDWELVPLYELRNKDDRYSFTGGPFGSDLKSENYTDTGVRVLQLQNIGEGEFINKGAVYVTEEKADELHSCNIYPGEIILAKMAPVARCCKIPSIADRFIMCSDGIRLSVDQQKFDNEYIFQALNSGYFRNEVESQSTGSTRARIGLNDLKLIPLAIPRNKAEQQKIAIILRTVDEKVEIIDAKIAQTSELKRGLMQKLLTRGIGHTKFKDSVLGEIPDSWEVKPIVEIASVVRGASPRPKGDPRYYGGTIPRLMGSDVTRDGKYVFPKVDFLTEEGAKLSRFMKAGTLVMICSGDVGVPSILGVDACVHDGFLAFPEISKECTIDFLYYIFDSLHDKFNSSATHGGVFTNLTTSIIKDFKIALPVLKEQVEIANVLSTVDHKINILQTQKRTFQDLKKGLMQQLLTGKVRVFQPELEIA